jgi:uncharacterized protein YeeX (DUF496 family)
MKERKLQMDNSTVQQPQNKPRKFIELPGKNKDRTLEAACYGNSRLGSLLDYFIYGANLEAERRNLDESCKVVTLTRKHKDIFDTLKKLKFNISRKTFIRYIGLLNQWGYVLSQPYGKTFEVCAEPILNAVNNPPQKDDIQKSCNVVDEKSKVVDEEKVTLRKKVEELQKKVEEGDKKVYLLQQKVDLLSHLQHLEPYVEQLVKLAQSTQENPYSNYTSNNLVITKNVPIGTTDETAKLPEQEDKQEINDANTTPSLTSARPTDTNMGSNRNGNSDRNADNSTSSSNKRDNKTIEQMTSLIVNPTTKENSTGSGSSEDTAKEEKNNIGGMTTRKRKYRQKTSETVEGPSQEPLPGIKEPKLSEEAKQVWDIWCDMPWNKGVQPKLTKTAADHCETLAKVGITREIMFKVRNFARSKKNYPDGRYEGKAWFLGHVVIEYPKWKSAQMCEEDDKESNILSFQQRHTPGVARSSYDDENYVDDTFYGQNLSLNNKVLARGATV